MPLETVTLECAESAARALSAGEIDAAFGYPRRPVARTDPRLAAAPARLEAFDAMVGAGHPLAAAARTVSLTDLAPYTIWMPGLVDGREWSGFYRDLTTELGLTVDGGAPDFGWSTLLDTVADSDALVTFVGRGSRVPRESLVSRESRAPLRRLRAGPRPMTTGPVVRVTRFRRPPHWPPSCAAP
ncbi:LysR substrate-binding domain-containing protein [Streptomyces sp. NPDC058953]|uniref:LysR substrate-binding domain-containing protein n=1 Tax=unclassified Streptomyces TaxID=2593676 RepID=UPI0036A50BE7